MTDAVKANRVARRCMALVLIEREAIAEALNALNRGDAERAYRLLRQREVTWAPRLENAPKRSTR